MAINNPVIADADIIQDTAVAIQEKDHGGKMEFPDMPSRIRALPTNLIPKTITQNGVYNASSDNADGYDVVTVSVLPPQPPEDLSVENKQIKMVIALTGEEIDPLECGISFIQTVANDIIIDWGDGSTEQSNAQINETIYNKTRYLHKYDKEGFYVITLTANNGELILPSNSWTGGSYLINSGLLYYNGLAYGIRNSNYARRLIGLYIGNAVELCDYSLYQLTNIKRINRMIKFPNVFEIPLNFSINAKNIIIPEGVEYIRASNISAQTAYSIKFPSTLKAINSNAFAANNAGGILIYDFSAINLVDGALPFSIQTNSFNSVINDSVKMVFKTQEIAEIAKSTTNLSTYADFITYEGAS